jgi:hypothetical protein
MEGLEREGCTICTLYSIEVGEDGEERFEEKPKKHLYLTVPPAVALLN